MKTDFFALYEAIAAGVQCEETISFSSAGELWTIAETRDKLGIAMSTPCDSIAAMHDSYEGLSLQDAAGAVGSWNLSEASLALAAANAYYNTVQRMEKLRAAEPYDNYCTAGLELEGKTVGMIGHLRGPEDLYKSAKQVYIIERSPQAGDYPDSACDYILPQCDIVLISGSSIINKTLPHLLELCENAYTILTGPSVPLCPELLDLGIDRLAGMAVTDCVNMRRHVLENSYLSPYQYGESFMLQH